MGSKEPSRADKALNDETLRNLAARYETTTDALKLVFSSLREKETEKSKRVDTVKQTSTRQR